VSTAMDYMGGMSELFAAPAGSAASTSSGGGKGGMIMMMQMWFQATTEVTLWFKEWKVDTHGKYAGSVVGLVLLCLLQEGISRTRTAVARQYGATTSKSVDVEAATPSLGRRLSPLVIRLLLSLLYALNLTTAYLLMLAVMTFNVGYFLAIISGLALGHFIFPPASGWNPPSMLSEACHPQF